VNEMWSRDYYDIDQILSEEETVPVKLKDKAIRIGYLDPLTAGVDLDENTQLEVPLWLAMPMADNEMIEIGLPASYGPQMISKLTLGSQLESLGHAPYFFENGLLLAQKSVANSAKDLPRELAAAFKTRYLPLLDKAHDNATTDSLDYIRLLSNRERKLFNIGRAVTSDFEYWKSGNTAFLEPSTLINQTNERRQNKI